MPTKYSIVIADTSCFILLDTVIAKIEKTNFRFSEATFDEIRKSARKYK